MSVSVQLRWRPQASTRLATLSAWVMSIVFVAIAAVSFAVDQAVDVSTAADGGNGELSGPAQLLHSWVDTVYGPFSRGE
jgi:hypothetical protein